MSPTLLSSTLSLSSNSKGVTMKMIDHVRGRVKFQYYREGNLYYETETGVLFAVPISDTAEATFLAEDKAILFMRYLRKHFEALEQN